MPLDGPDKTLAHHLKSFNDAVWGDGHGCQIIAEVFGGLVVQRVHFDNVPAQQRLQISVQFDLMCWDFIRLALSVDDFRRVLRREVLPERTA